jgi:N-acetylmuramoyl-L-alanine amidase
MRKEILASALVLFLFSSSISFAQTKSRIKTIIVDAGHGGNDQGAKGSYSTEAEITLKLALKVGQILEQELSSTKIIQTRTSDITQPVTEKAAFANQNKGDLFVCIHVNAASPNRHSQVIGHKTRTYYTGKGSKRRKHTKREPVYKVWYTPNPREGTATYVWAADRSTLKSDAVSERFESEGELTDVPDPSTPEGIIASRLWVQKYFKNSVKLASMIQDEFVKLGRENDGVLQRNEKGIWVLQATNMPAVLIETGFITNKSEEDYHNSSDGQDQISRAIADAVIAYKNQTDASRNGNSDSLHSNETISSSQAPSRIKKGVAPANLAVKTK